jgi:hypothetical protein
MVQHVDESSPFQSNACRFRRAPNSHAVLEKSAAANYASSVGTKTATKESTTLEPFVVVNSEGQAATRSSLSVLVAAFVGRPSSRILSIPTRGMDTDQAPGRTAVALHQQQQLVAAAAVGAAPPSSPTGTDGGSPRYSNDTTLLEGTNRTHERAMSLCFVRILLVVRSFYSCEVPPHSLIVRFFLCFD